MVKAVMFQTHQYESAIFAQVFADYDMQLTQLEPRLTAQTAPLGAEHDAVISFVNDVVDASALAELARHKVALLALRCAGFNHVDLAAAERCGISVVRVPAYSPYAVAEHTACLLMALNRKLHKAVMRVHSLNFSLDGLVGFDLHGKTVGVIGTGKIGAQFARIMHGFGCRVLTNDLHQDPTLGGFCESVSLRDLLQQADVISLHVPLVPETHHLLNQETLGWTKPGVVIINTSRGALIDSKALIACLKSGHIGGAALDVYEEEEGVFFQDLSDTILQDDTLARLLTFPNILITSHQAFLTREALQQIAQTTAANINQFFRHGSLQNVVTTSRVQS